MEYAERTMQLWDESERGESVGYWEKVNDVMVRAAKEVCSECEKVFPNTWVIEYEESI